MGYKILDVKADIHEDVEKYMQALYSKKLQHLGVCHKETLREFVETLNEDVLDIVDKHFEKIER